SVCASGGTDAIGGSIHTDAEGNLASSQAGMYTDLPLVWACAQNKCLDTEMRKCVQGTQGPSGVTIACSPAGGGAGARAVRKARGPFGTPNPPSGRFMIGGKMPGPVGAGGMFSLLPVEPRLADGTSQIFCAPLVPFAAGEMQDVILQRAADMVNGDGGCRAAGVQAGVEASQAGQVEDEFPQPASLTLTAPDLTGGRLIPGLRIMPGQAMGTCFSAGDLDDMMRGFIRSMKIQFATAPGGGTGAPIRIVEQSPLGRCDITVPAPAGAGGAGIAAAVAAAF